VELGERGIPAVAIVSPAFEGQARAYGESLGLPAARVVVLPIGEAPPDAAESVPRIRAAAAESLPAVERGLGGGPRS
jgi:hypothetical protein